MFENLNNEMLLVEIKKCVGEERRISVLVLDYLREVEKRQLFALRGYSSLYEFCMRELGYSESESYRRIAAMRSMRDLPQAREKLSDGTVSLSTLSQLYSFTRSEEKRTHTKMDQNKRAELFSRIENKSQKECELEFIKLRPEYIVQRESTKQVSVEFTEIKFLASVELMEQLAELKDLLGNRGLNGHAGLVAEIAKIAMKTLKKKTAARVNPVETAKAEDTKSGIAFARKAENAIPLGKCPRSDEDGIAAQGYLA